MLENNLNLLIMQFITFFAEISYWSV